MAVTIVDIPASTLPIEVISTNPLKFRWWQIVDTPNGKRVVANEGALPVSVEVAVKRLIEIAKDLTKDNAALMKDIKFLHDKVEKAETPTYTTTPQSHRKVK